MTYSFYYWGPLLFRTTVSKEDIDRLKSICSKDKTKDFRKKLAGIIDHEYEIDIQKYTNIISPYFNYFKEACYQFYNAKEITKMETTVAWVNYMKKTETNPLHMHPECDFSSVVFLDIPEELKKENKEYLGSSSGPGSIQFLFGEPYKHNISQKSFFPETGDFFIFPGTLRHTVYSFKSDIERVSLSANYKIEMK